MQSGALARFVGRMCGLYPEDHMEQLVCDEILETINELMAKCGRDPDPEKMKAIRQVWLRPCSMLTSTRTAQRNVIAREL